MHARISTLLNLTLFAIIVVAGPTFKASPGPVVKTNPRLNHTNATGPGHMPRNYKDKDCDETTTTTATTTSSQCDTGSLQCCTSMSTPEDVPNPSDLLASLLGSISGLVGAGCSPILPVGAGSGASCSANPVCCSGNTFTSPGGSILNLGCSPITGLS